VKQEYLKYLVCPVCSGELRIVQVGSCQGDAIEHGLLGCDQCPAEYTITNYIPRFVISDDYTISFGFQWTKYARTQYDSHTGTTISERRFFDETKWPRQLKGDVILEVGSGSGRFTEQAASTGATVISMDYSYACCRANYDSNGGKNNVLIVQADIYKMPFREAFFDKAFCFGVLQHTPDVEKSFMTILRYLKHGGRLAIDVYRRPYGVTKHFIPKYWLRPLCKRVKGEVLHAACEKWVNFMWPWAKIINKIPRHGRTLNQILLVPDYRGVLELGDEQLKQWAILDAFDTLSPVYDNPQTLDDVRSWFEKAPLVNWEVDYGYNGIEGRGIKAA
jgi:ubiquinone/menaquinone biosynthesis C-methylase UbiE/uncharacterized protein YbaR (Trm112 family)